MVRTPCFHCRDAGSVPGQEVEIPHAAQGGTKKKKMRATETQKFGDFSTVTRNIGAPGPGLKARPGGSGPCSLPGAQLSTSRVPLWTTQWPGCPRRQTLPFFILSRNPPWRPWSCMTLDCLITPASLSFHFPAKGGQENTLPGVTREQVR